MLSTPARLMVPLLVTPELRKIVALVVGPVSVIRPALLRVPELPKKLPTPAVPANTRVPPASLSRAAPLAKRRLDPPSTVRVPELSSVRPLSVGPNGLPPPTSPLFRTSVVPAPLIVPPVHT